MFDIIRRLKITLEIKIRRKKIYISINLDDASTN